jgi:hypothetical protein
MRKMQGMERVGGGGEFVCSRSSGVWVAATSEHTKVIVVRRRAKKELVRSAVVTDTTGATI